MSNPKSNNAKYVQHGSILSRLIRRRSSQSSDSSVEIPTEVTRNQSFVRKCPRLVRPGLRAPCVANSHSESTMTQLSEENHEIFAKKRVRVKSLPNLIDIEKELRRPHFIKNQDCPLSLALARRKSSPQLYHSQEFMSQSSVTQNSFCRPSVAPNSGYRPSVPLPKQSHSLPFAPQQLVSRSSEPQQFVFRSSVPRQFVSQSSEPQQFGSRPSVPQQFVSRSSVPQQFVSRSSVPQQFVSRSSVPQQFGSRPSVPQQFISRPSVPQQYGSRPSVPQQFVSRPSVPQQFVSRPSVPQQFVSRPSVPQQFVSRPSVPQQFVSRPSVPQQFVSRPSVPQQFVSRPSVPQQFVSRPSVPQQYGSRPSVPQQFDSRPQQFVPRAFELQERLHKLRNPIHSTDHLSANFMARRPPKLNNSMTSLPCSSFAQPTNSETSHQPSVRQFNTGKRFINAQTSVDQSSSALYSGTELSLSHAPLFQPLAKSKPNNLVEKPILSSTSNNIWNHAKPHDFPKAKSVVMSSSKPISRAHSITVSKQLPLHRPKLLPSTISELESKLKVRKRSVSMTVLLHEK